MSRIPPKELRAMLCNPYRKKRDTPRPDCLPTLVFEEPAPPWVPAILDGLLPRLTRLDDGGYLLVHQLLAWCAAGDPVGRAEQVLTIAKLWVGELAPMLQLFVAAARKTNAGRSRTGKYRPIVPVTVEWDWKPVAPARVVVSAAAPEGSAEA